MEQEEILDILREVYDPDYRDWSVVDMGLVSVAVRLKPGHLQEQVVNEVLSSSERRVELLKKLEDYGLLAQCVKLGEV